MDEKFIELGDKVQNKSEKTYRKHYGIFLRMNNVPV